MTGPILPGSTLGVVGGGQLGRMFAVAARRLGYRVAVWSDDAGAPALAIADLPIRAPYDDTAALAAFTGAIDACTVEFENLPADLLRAIEDRVPLRPSAAAIAATQHRGREKRALAELGAPLAPWRPLDAAGTPDAAAAALAAVSADIGRPAVLKTAGFGYDGKGQVAIPASGPWPDAALALLAAQPCVLEAFVDLELELSVVVARSPGGEVRAFPVAENHHARHVLDLTVMPARVGEEVARRAEALARRVVTGMGVVGLACVELFLTRAGDLWVNEVAPRPHNSGHVTIEACRVDQFEQQVRAVCGLPLGDPAVVRPGAMANLLGDLWEDGEPDWRAALAVDGARLHLYGKTQARPGRKMGHLSAVADDAAAAAEVVLAARAALTAGAAPTPRPRA
ncbi:MAG: 5-(carboxyamino)imidazole ribonucleotide synthase [Trueperaceae bacterium]